MPKTVNLEPITQDVVRAADARNLARKNAPTFVTAVALDEWNGALRLWLRSGLELRIPIAAIGEIAREPIERLRHMRRPQRVGFSSKTLISRSTRMACSVTCWAP